MTNLMPKGLVATKEQLERKKKSSLGVRREHFLTLSEVCFIHLDRSATPLELIFQSAVGILALSFLMLITVTME